MAGQYVVSGACIACTVKPTQGYFLQPVGFDGKANLCPWDCNAGYYKVSDNCISCTLGTSYSSTLSTKEDDDLNFCHLCKRCEDEAQSSYQTQTCTIASNRVCTTCHAACTGRTYESTACSPLQDRVCTNCNPCGSNNYIFSDCSNSASTDTKVCKPCLTGANCIPGTTFMPVNSLCTGIEHSSNFCQLCTSSITCSASQYIQRCTGGLDSMCRGYTVCNSGFYLANKGSYNDGTCTPCTTCSSTPALACTTNSDALCQGEACGSNPCRGSLSLLCTQVGVCAVCPSGYSSDGYNCHECPQGKTCNDGGIPVCEGEVNPGQIPECNGLFAQPQSPCTIPTNPLKLVTTGSFVGDTTACAPYFQCVPGLVLAWGWFNWCVSGLVLAWGLV